MAHYDPDGLVAPHVRHNIEALCKVADRVVVVSTADLQPAEAQWLRSRVEVLDYEEIFGAMDELLPDFWGLTRTDRVRPRLQSFFVCFHSWVVGSATFQCFWRDMVPLSDRRQVILRDEVGLSRALQDAKFNAGSFFRENDDDRRVARRRMAWRAALVTGQPNRRTRERYERMSQEPWNPCAGLADRALGEARLPFIKIDTLRFDPYGHGPARLLEAAERERPAAFAGVRDDFDRTANYYPPRSAEVLPSPSVPLRALRRTVRYA